MQELRDDVKEMLRANLARLRERVANASESVGRNAQDVRLVAVTKKQPAAAVAALLDLGVDAVGENRPEDIVRKQSELDRPVPWHMIGHFQRKKVAKSLSLIDLIHSVHSLELLGTLDVRAESPASILIQVNVSSERTKQGFSLEQAEHVVDLAEACTHVTPRGLMTMAPHDAPQDLLHEVFGRLRELRDRLGADRLPELSMGMSGDFETAVAEGATMIRVGSALFDGAGVEP